MSSWRDSNAVGLRCSGAAILQSARGPRHGTGTTPWTETRRGTCRCRTRCCRSARVCPDRQRAVDPIVDHPAQDRAGNEFRAMIRAQHRRCPVQADKPAQDLDDALRSDATGDVDSQAFSGILVDDRQASELLAVGTTVEDEIVDPDRVRLLRRDRTGLAGPPSSTVRGCKLLIFRDRGKKHSTTAGPVARWCWVFGWRGPPGCRSAPG